MKNGWSGWTVGEVDAEWLEDGWSGCKVVEKWIEWLDSEWKMDGVVG